MSSKGKCEDCGNASILRDCECGDRDCEDWGGMKLCPHCWSIHNGPVPCDDSTCDETVVHRDTCQTCSAALCFSHWYKHECALCGKEAGQ